MAVRSLNKVLLIGNLTRDPELRYTSQGTAVCSFGLATNRTWTPSDGGDKQEETEFHRIVAWAKLAEICSQILYKGRKVYVEGRLQTRKWQSQDGQDHETTEVVIDQMIALGPPKPGSYEDSDESMAGGEEDYDEGSSEIAAGGPAEISADAGADMGEEVEEAPTKSKSAQNSTQSEEEEVDVDDIPF